MFVKNALTLKILPYPIIGAEADYVQLATQKSANGTEDLNKENLIRRKIKL